MNSSHKPLFVYSYDPPSPDVISEYDPPYPLEIATTPLSDTDLFHFPNIELDNSITVYRAYRSLCKFSQSNNDDDVELNNVPSNSFGQADTRNFDVEEIIDANGDCKMDDGATKSKLENNFSSFKTENNDLNHVSMINEEKQSVYEYGTPSDKHVPSLDLLNFCEISSSTSLDTDNETESTLFIPEAIKDNNAIDLSRGNDDIPLHFSSSRSSTESLEISKLNDTYIYEPKDETCSLTLTSCDASETFYPSDIATDEARYTSPESTSQSLSSLPSDTITINVPCDSPSPGGESHIFDLSDNKENSGVANDDCSTEVGTAVQRNSLSLSSDCDGDSLLFASSPVASPPLTDSCTITPFPTDFPTPYSTNPTSSPLPSDFLNQQSESSSSTPSTVTSSTMFCVSRKLENLTTNLSANDLASNNENCSMDANKNNEAKNAVSNGMHIESFSCLQNNLISDTADNTIENMVFIVGKRSSSLSEKNELECTDKTVENCRKIETSNVSELKKKYLESISESFQHNKPKNDLKSNIDSDTKIQEENKNQECRNDMPSKECGLFKKEPEVKSDTRGPPLPPPRIDSTQKQIPPPLPPPPNEDSDAEDAPPVPSLPLHFIAGNISPSPPSPPVRQYLLIPLTPGRITPILLTPPPPAPQRSSSYRKSPPPIPPKPKLCNSDVDLKINKKCGSNCLTRCSEHTVLQNNRYLPLVRELTPVPEEVTSPTRQSPPCVSPLRNNSSNLLQEKASDETTCGENMHISTKVQRDLNVPTTRSSSVSDGKHIRPSPSPPPPLPPKPSGLKPLLALKTPPPPPPIRTESLPGTPGTPDSNKSGSRLSPCRLKDRSPPSDRKFTPTTDSDRESSSAQKPVSLSNSPNIPPPAPAAPISRNKTSCMTVSPYGKLVINRSDLPLPFPEEEVRKVYTNVKNWGWIDNCADTLTIYTQFRPLIQQGPMCGLVALGMASQACPSTVSSEELLKKVKDKGISHHGEMFSAKAMSELANEVLIGVKATVRKDVLPSSLSVIRILLDGDYILFPYDAEPNHFPGLKKGHKAHWGLLCGCLIQNKALTFCSEASHFNPDPKTDNLWHLRPVSQFLGNERSTSVPPSRAPIDPKLRISRSVSPYQISKEDKSNLGVLTANKLGYRNGILNEADFNVICLYRQGKSRNLIYAPLKDIYESNAQIVEYPTTEDYVIDSVEEGLSRQIIVLHKEIPGLSDLLGTLQEEEKI